MTEGKRKFEEIRNEFISAGREIYKPILGIVKEEDLWKSLQIIWAQFSSSSRFEITQRSRSMALEKTVASQDKMETIMRTVCPELWPPLFSSFAEDPLHLQKFTISLITNQTKSHPSNLESGLLCVTEIENNISSFIDSYGAESIFPLIFDGESESFKKKYCPQLLLHRRDLWLLLFLQGIVKELCEQLSAEDQKEKRKEIENSPNQISFDDAFRLFSGQPPHDIRFCDFCKKREFFSEQGETKLKRCSQCKKVWYCSRTCQKEDWGSGHRLVCGKQ